MKCYIHKTTDALGTCKSCSKGVCEECAFDTGNGLACKNSCVEEVRAVNEVIERNKQIYRISRTVLSTDVIVYFMLAAVCLGWGIFSSLAWQLNLFAILGGLCILAIGILAYSREKRVRGRKRQS
jgi:hypothetical protein